MANGEEKGMSATVSSDSLSRVERLNDRDMHRVNQATGEADGTGKKRKARSVATNGAAERHFLKRFKAEGTCLPKEEVQDDPCDTVSASLQSQPCEQARRGFGHFKTTADSYRDMTINLEERGTVWGRGGELHRKA